MVFGFNRGRGSRGGMGFGFRGSSPPWPYVGRGRGGLPRCGYYGASAGWTYSPRSFYQGTSAAPGYTAGMAEEDELTYMKDRAEAIKQELGDIETRMRDLESKK